VITGIATVAVYSVQSLTSKRIEDLVARISGVEQASINTIQKISSDQGKAEGAAAFALAKADESAAALKKLNNDIENANAALPFIKDLQTLTNTIASKPEFIAAVSTQLKPATTRETAQIGNSFDEVTSCPLLTLV
jgi:hypothetical protein